ncbi:MAG: endolytic transglycosylase MltG [Candidatus Roizmanbacteria bacterium]|nr:endolytic transglycosylase MltG [Candidatus Roizmanbacteria bacterium]
MKKFKILFLLIALIILGIYFMYTEGSLPVDKRNTGSTIFKVEKGDGLFSVTKKLASEDLIRNKLIFTVIAFQSGIDKKIQAGEFKLSKKMSAQEVADALTHGTVDEWITIVEGLRKEEIAQKLAQTFTFSEISFIEQAKEGQLFPDTYLIPKTATMETIIQLMETNFQKKMAEARAERPFEKRSDREVLILASLVEREAKFADDRRLVASIILKRAQSDWPLQLDATIQYGLGYQRKEKTWWKRDLAIEDLKVDNTYNTYERKGLPPAPICNPGLDSIKAALAADPNTPYWYYVNDKKGRIQVAKTLEEHNENIRKFVQ